MLKLYLPAGYDKSLAPAPATRYREWWEGHYLTQNHARHCLPLAMANSLGYYILSPGTFEVQWDGDLNSKAIVTCIEASSHYIVDNHSANGSFTVQPGFIPVTDNPGEFVFIKGIPNQRGMPYSCMEACIESWWSVANFGLVFLLNQACKFTISKGDPIAQMFVLSDKTCGYPLEFIEGVPERHQEWAQKRHRKDYRKDLDYLKGLHPDGSKVDYHVSNWKATCPHKKE